MKTPTDTVAAAEPEMLSQTAHAALTEMDIASGQAETPASPSPALLYDEESAREDVEAVAGALFLVPCLFVTPRDFVQAKAVASESAGKTARRIARRAALLLPNALPLLAILGDVGTALLDRVIERRIREEALARQSQGSN